MRMKMPMNKPYRAYSPVNLKHSSQLKTSQFNLSQPVDIQFAGKKPLKTLLASAIVGLACLAPAGCERPADTMQKQYQTIPANERLNFLQEQFTKSQEASVRERIFTLLTELKVPSKEKISLILKGLSDSSGQVFWGAMNAGDAIVENPDVSFSLREALKEVLTTVPWTETYRVKVGESPVMVPMPDGNGGFYYITQYQDDYETRTRAHGNASAYPAARKALEKLLEN